MYLTLAMLSVVISEGEKELFLLFIIRTNLNFGYVVGLSLKYSKNIPRVISDISIVSIFFISITPATCTICLIICQVWCHLHIKRVSHWLPIILIILSNHINLNPGPNFQNNSFNFMTWNVNSLAKDNFQRVNLIEAHNSIFNYDLISICETSLNDSVELPDILLNDYTFVPANNPANSRNGGLGLFYKNSLPVIVRNDLCFDESIVVELKFGRKENSLLYYIELLLLTVILLSSKFFCQTLNNYIQKSKLKIPLQYFLQGILMPTPSSGGLMATQHLKVQKLKNFSVNLGYLNSSQNQRILNLTRNPRALI